MESIIINKQGKNDPDYDRIKWSLIARSKDETRPALMRVKVLDGRFITTDGHRLHIAKSDRSIDDGLYAVVSNNGKQIILTKDEEGYMFPEYLRVIPEGVPEKQAGITTKDNDPSPLVREAYRMGYFKLNYLLDTYMNDAFVDMKYYGKGKPLVMEEKSGEDVMRLALVMGIREE